MNRLTVAGLAFGMAFSATTADRAAAADLSECVGISDEAVRLFCYDRVAGRAPSTPSPPATQAPAAAPPVPSQPASDAAKAGPPPSGTAATAAPAAADPKRLEARIVGRFEGWSKGTRFRLDNGQVWEAVGASTHYSTSDSPNVVIERDLIGQHLMSIEGVKSRALVRRVND